MTKPETFVTRIGCIDGREGDAVFAYVKKNCVASYVDSIAMPGMVALLAAQDVRATSLVTEQLLISLKSHESKAVIVSGHEQCESNQVTDVDHHVHIHKASEVVRALLDEIGYATISVKELWVQQEVDTNEWYAEYIGLEGRVQLSWNGQDTRASE